jgi:hypothetical protein
MKLNVDVDARHQLQIGYSAFNRYAGEEIRVQ